MNRCPPNKLIRACDVRKGMVLLLSEDDVQWVAETDAKRCDTRWTQLVEFEAVKADQQGDASRRDLFTLTMGHPIGWVQ